MSRQPSHLRAAVRLVGTRLRRSTTAPAPSAAPSRKLAVERAGISIDVRRVARYLAATRGGSDRTERQTLPPTFVATWETALTLELLADETIPFPRGGLVHLGSDLISIRPISMRDSHLRVRVELDRMEVHRRGTVLVLRGRVWNDTGHLCQENRTRVLLMGVTPPPGAGRRVRSDEERSKGTEEWREVAAWDLASDAGRIFARASGDFNPIHLWPWSARLMGFPRPILHGHCSIAMVGHELERITGGVMRRLSAEFRSPLELPARVRLETAEAGSEGATALRLIGDDPEGKPYLVGIWVGAAQSPGTAQG